MPLYMPSVKMALRHAILATALLIALCGCAAYAVDVDAPPDGALPGASVPGSSVPGSSVPDETAVRTVFLTFDDGPYQPWTQQMLDVLAEYNAHATFFMIGRQAVLEPDTLQKIYDGGNGLGNHGYNHSNLTGVSQQFFNAEVGDTGALFGDMNSMCLRPPYGAIDYNVVDFADQLGYSVVKWNMDPEDWRNPGADEIARHVIDNARDGSIVVMHDGGGDRSQTVEAVRTILKTLIAQGYQFKALCRDFPMADLTNALLETPTPDPDATATPAPTATPSPAETAWPTATPTPTVTHTPGPTSRADATRVSVVPPSATVSPMATRKATPTIGPSTTPSAPLESQTPMVTPARTPLAAPGAPAALATDETVSAEQFGQITFPAPGAIVSGALLVQGYADHASFEKWQLDLLVSGGEPVFLAVGDASLPGVGRLGVWNTRAFSNGPHMLRLRVVYRDGNYAEYFTHVTVAN